MKKVLLLFISLICLNLPVFSYQTVLVDFPSSQGWHAVYYDKIFDEAILQYAPSGQTADDWTRTMVFHSYKNLSWTDSAAKLMDRLTMQMEAKNSTQLYKYTKYSEADSIATRCVTKNKYIPAQCEIFRVSRSHEGLITMHYINKNVNDFKNNYNQWYEIVKKIRIYYSYYLDDRVLDKSTSFSL